MDELNQTSVVTPEEQNAEKEMTIEVTDEQLRDKLLLTLDLIQILNKTLLTS